MCSDIHRDIQNIIVQKGTCSGAMEDEMHRGDFLRSIVFPANINDIYLSLKSQWTTIHSRSLCIIYCRILRHLRDKKIYHKNFLLH